MQFPTYSHLLTGTAISVGSLKTGDSCGIGEFLDLIPLATFCKKTNLDIIQLLPVNDTGTESSPYSALSAFALHPIYIRLQAIPEAQAFSSDIEKIRSTYEALPRFPYRKIREEKLDLLRRIFDANEKKIIAGTELSLWIEKNPWVRIYAVFMNLKHRNFEASWKSWKKMVTPTLAEIQERWDSEKRKSDHLFYAWVQMRLDEQFSQAVSWCAKQGVALKGDIPIMMNEDSADAWAYPAFFRDDLRAGSPADDSNPLGQNWGFPIYNWENLKADGYSWWIDRLKQAEKYYHAYRIDHILGFFRIWSIPNGEITGALGWTNPLTPITSGELAALGFSGDRLRWICEPHVPTKSVEEVNNFDYLGTHGLLHTLMNKIDNEELWLFKKEVQTESDIWKVDLPVAVKEVLAREWRNRMLVKTGRDEKGKPLFTTMWTYKKTTAWDSLSTEEKRGIEALVEKKNVQNELLWKQQAEELLKTLSGSVSMLACAEDLGTIPESVPGVLSHLGILGLKVIRWEKKWTEEGHPFKDIRDYPYLSVATSSVHDSSTLRLWWENENGAQEFMNQWSPEQEGYPSDARNSFLAEYTPDAATFVLSVLAKTSSSILIIPIQDLLALSPLYKPQNSTDERINIPGSVTPFNWTYRLPVEIESLLKNKKLISEISDIIASRRRLNINQGAH